MPKHYLNQSWCTGNCILRNKRTWNWYKNATVIIPDNEGHDICSQTILSRSQYVIRTEITMIELTFLQVSHSPNFVWHQSSSSYKMIYIDKYECPKLQIKSDKRSFTYVVLRICFDSVISRQLPKFTGTSVYSIFCLWRAYMWLRTTSLA